MTRIGNLVVGRREQHITITTRAQESTILFQWENLESGVVLKTSSSTGVDETLKLEAIYYASQIPRDLAVHQSRIPLNERRQPVQGLGSTSKGADSITYCGSKPTNRIDNPEPSRLGCQHIRCRLLAKSRLSGHVSGTSALPPTADIRAPMSALNPKRRHDRAVGYFQDSIRRP